MLAEAKITVYLRLSVDDAKALDRIMKDAKEETAQDTIRRLIRKEAQRAAK